MSWDAGMPWRRAIPAMVSPGATTWVAGAPAAGVGPRPPEPPGSRRVVPTTMRFGSRMALSDARADTVVPCRAAMAASVSPGRTT
jgi:hypothetical protein